MNKMLVDIMTTATDYACLGETTGPAIVTLDTTLVFWCEGVYLFFIINK